MTSHITTMEEALQKTKGKVESLSGDFKNFMLNANARNKRWLMQQSMKLFKEYGYFQ